MSGYGCAGADADNLPSPLGVERLDPHIHCAVELCAEANGVRTLIGFPSLDGGGEPPLVGLDLLEWSKVGASWERKRRPRNLDSTVC